MARPGGIAGVDEVPALRRSPRGHVFEDVPHQAFRRGFTLRAARVPHIESSLAYRIEAEGKTLVYSGDTDYSDALIELARGSDALIIECALPDDESKRSGHLTPGEVIETANRSGAKRVIVTHLYPVCDEMKVVERIRKSVRAEVTEARDLLQIEV